MACNGWRGIAGQRREWDSFGAGIKVPADGIPILSAERTFLYGPRELAKHVQLQLVHDLLQ
jgi:hypothetical protein